MSLKTLLKNFEEILCGAFILSMVVLVITNVLLRSVFSYSIFWAEEVSTICFVWSVFLGGAACYKNKMDIGIDLLITKTPPMVQKIVKIGVDLSLLVINGFVFYLAMQFAVISSIKPTPVLGVSSLVFSSALVFGFGLTTWHTLRFILSDILKSQTPSREQT
jgi:TRAP-type C4-dicarboxylate transport system permease small subunit